VAYSFFIKGIILGISIAAPVGPIGILCIRRTLQFGRFSGLFSGLGAAVADSMYALVAAFGLTIVSDFLITGHFWLQLVGGLFLLYLGWRTFFAKPNDAGGQVPHTTLLNDFISTFFLTILNPMTILAFLAMFASLGLSSSQVDYVEVGTLVSAVFLGSAIWWLILSEGVTLFRKKVSQRVMLWINRIAGIMIAAFGAAVLLTLI